MASSVLFHWGGGLVYLRRYLGLDRLGLRNRDLGFTLDPLLEAAQPFAQTFAQLGQLARTKDEQCNDQDEQKVGRCKQIIKHVWDAHMVPRGAFLRWEYCRTSETGFAAVVSA